MSHLSTSGADDERHHQEKPRGPHEAARPRCWVTPSGPGSPEREPNVDASGRDDLPANTRRHLGRRGGSDLSQAEQVQGAKGA
jgi:hypothetical protein